MYQFAFDQHHHIHSHFLLCVILDCHHYMNPNCNQDIQSCRRWFCARKLSFCLLTMATPSVFCSFALFQCHMLQSNHCTRLSTQTSNNQLKISKGTRQKKNVENSIFGGGVRTQAFSTFQKKKWCLKCILSHFIFFPKFKRKIPKFFKVMEIALFWAL